MAFSGRRILVVEDEFLASLTTVDFLEGKGCEVVGPVGRLTTAVRLARSETLDAAVLDINLDGEMVWPVAEELQRRGVPFVFLSAYAHHAASDAFSDVPHLDKPLEKAKLLYCLDALWGEPAPAEA